MKRFLHTILAAVLCLTLFGGTAAMAEEAPEEEPNFTEWETLVTEDVLEVPIVWEKLPSGYGTYDNEHEGTVLRLHYDTDAYEDGEVHEKYCTVYLPYGYDENDTETKYNVIYFQHGNSGSPNEFWDHIMKTVDCNKLFNNIFDDEIGVLDKCIIICPTYYFEIDEAEYTTRPADSPAGDGRTEGIPGNYFDEIVDDLIPQIESQFNVYCEDFSREGIKASREHRMWAGYSRGSRCTWNVLHNDFEYFKYWMPCSGIVDPVDGTDVTAIEDAYAYVTEQIAANPDLDFYLMCYIGGPKDQEGRESYVELMKYMEKQEMFSYGTNPEENNFYFVMSDFLHNDLYFPFILANTRDFLFK